MTPNESAERTDFDNPDYYEPAGMKPQCTYIVHWHSCRLDAGHAGKHSPGHIEARARALAHERSAGAAPLDVEVNGHQYVHVAACPCQPPMQPIDVDWDAEGTDR